jgi:S-adenosylmethionine-diacylglycerol 3-amino-3-carboxypropyl transferase
MKCELAQNARLDYIRYSQCWEDSETVIGGMRIKPGDTCLSIASGGDNSLGLLACDPGKVIAIDASLVQLYLLELKAAAFALLSYSQMLEFLGYHQSDKRLEYFILISGRLSPDCLDYWQGRLDFIEKGVCRIGKFERYFSIFRCCILPLVHNQTVISELLRPKDSASREKFYDEVWNSKQWRFMFRLFFSRPIMSRLGRSAEMFKYARGSLSSALEIRVRKALVEQEPADNPYLRWILTGSFGSVLPFYLRRENFEKIKSNLDRLEIRHHSLESYLEQCADKSLDSCNLSDIFEYMSLDSQRQILELLGRKIRPDARLVYFNMMVPRSSLASGSSIFALNNGLSEKLSSTCATFFYSRLLVEDSCPS